jgi:hypothetical protein
VWLLQEGPTQIWAGPLANNDRAVILFNRHIGGQPPRIRVTWAQLGYTYGPASGSGFKATVRDLYAERNLGVFENEFETDVDAHDVAVLRITPVSGQAFSSSGSSSSGGGSSGGSSVGSLCGRDSYAGSVRGWQSRGGVLSVL